MRFLEDAVAFGRKVVISDVHLGLLRFHDRYLVERLATLADRYGTLIIAGDLKHMGRRVAVRDILNELKERTEVITIRGNHDIGIETDAGARGIRIGKYGIFHGHAYPGEDVASARHYIFGHAHPSLYISDGVGGIKERVFLIGKVDVGGEEKKVTVLPAFNDLCASTAVNLDRPAGFAFRKWNYRNWEAVLPDGTILSIY